jgi:hypothetical protein
MHVEIVSLTFMASSVSVPQQHFRELDIPVVRNSSITAELLLSLSANLVLELDFNFNERESCLPVTRCTDVIYLCDGIQTARN